MEVQTLELWPRQAYLIITDKGLKIKTLYHWFKYIIFPWDNNYDQQRMLFSCQIQERPLFIIRPINESEIKKVLNMLLKYKLSIRMVGGRHSTALQNPDIFLDMSYFKDISLNISKTKVRVGAGCTQGEVNAFLFKRCKDHHFPGAKPNHPNVRAFPGGSAATVGVAGISTAGGIGTLRRTLGLTIDSIKAFQIVVPPSYKRYKDTGYQGDTSPSSDKKVSCKLCSSKVITVSSTKYPDLFWALLGGGGANFGVITQIIYRLITIPPVILYEVRWPFSQANEVLSLWQKTSIDRPSQFNEDLSFYTIIEQGHTVPIIDLTGIYVLSENSKEKDSKENEKKAMLHIRKQLKSIVDLGGTLIMDPSASYSKIYQKFVDSRVYRSFSTGRTMLTKSFIPPENIIESIQKALTMSGQSYIGFQLMGGEISRVKSYETAYYPRQAHFFIDIFSFWSSPVDQSSNERWNEETFNLLYPMGGPYVYVGFPIPQLPDHLYAYYGSNKERLLDVKNRVDPFNLLKFPSGL